VKALNSWIKPPSPMNTFFLVSNFPNLVILVGKKMENNCANSKKVVNKNFATNFLILKIIIMIKFY